MNKDITLVILAAGMGSRFGGLKQITPLGPNEEFIIDYSVYDAIKAANPDEKQNVSFSQDTQRRTDAAL